MNGKCDICGEERDLRLGACWKCAEAESIIDEGLDMDDNGLEGDKPAKKPMDKLRLLILKGWNTK